MSFFAPENAQSPAQLSMVEFVIGTFQGAFSLSSVTEAEHQGQTV